MNENEKKNKPKLPNLEYRFIFVNSGPRQLKRTWKRDFTREGFRFFSKKQFIEIKLKISPGLCGRHGNFESQPCV